MSHSTIVEPITCDTWANLAPQFLDHNYRQSWAFAVACARRVGATSEHVAIRRGTEVLGISDVRVKRMPLLPAGIAYINGGPLVRVQRNGDLERLALCLGALVREYVGRRRLALRVLAPIGEETWNVGADRVFREIGFRPTGRGSTYRTLLLDLARRPEEIRADFLQKWRNCLNSAERKGLEIELGTDQELFDRFCTLFRDFLARKKFAVNLDADFYATVQRLHLENERYLVSLATQNSNTVAGHVACILGNSCVYLLGATNSAGLKSHAAYLLQWSTIRAAQERDVRWYDLGGIDPRGNPGVYHFKKGLNGVEVSAAGPYEVVPDRLTDRLTLAVESAYRALQRLRPKLVLRG